MSDSRNIPSNEHNELIDRVCRGVASIQEGQQLREYIEDLCKRVDFAAAALTVVERRRDQLKAERDALKANAHETGVDQCLTQAALDILVERHRQVTEEGWSTAHDDAHHHGQLAKAGGIYALKASLADDENSGWFGDVFARKWPWSRKWWKPKDPRRDLVKAGALILAEIERLDRANALKACAVVSKPWTMGGNLVGTSMQGYARFPYARIVEVFGEPQHLGEDGDKVAFEWTIMFADGTIASIYDYKASSIYGDGDDAPTPEEMKVSFEDWHIGGHRGGKAVEHVLNALNGGPAHG